MSTFLPLIFRMKHIRRWSLMHNTQEEDLMQHTVETAFITHYLAQIGNACFGKDYDADRLAVYALYHDVAEVFTGDLPTPIKYFNDDMRATYKQIEETAIEKLEGSLPEELRAGYSAYLEGEGLSAEERALLKTADKLCAYIKCKKEIDAGNREFEPACKAIEDQLDEADGEELRYFRKNCLDLFALSLDELEGTL